MKRASYARLFSSVSCGVLVLSALSALSVIASSCTVQPAYPPASGPPPSGPVYGSPPPGGGGYASGAPIEAGCSYNATQIQAQMGAVVQVSCPPGCENSGGLWGTDVYTADSAICKAAIHAGALSPGGGVVAVRLEPGRPAYRGSDRNGVRSSDYGNYGTSYAVLGAEGGAPPAPSSSSSPPPSGPPITLAPANSGPVIEAGCSYGANQIHDGLGTIHTVSCPPGCQSQGGLWGTDLYTGDSAICRAAIHAGLITPQGGTVRVILEAGRPAYRGSDRNGVHSSDYGSYTSSFRLTRP